MPDVSHSNRTDTPPQKNSEERRAHPVNTVSEERNQLDAITSHFGAFQFSDIFTAAQHSRDFRSARAEYIVKRLRFMLLFFVIAVPSWIGIDYLTLTAEQFSEIVTLRIALSGSLLTLLLLCSMPPRHHTANLLLLLSFTAPCIFYLFAMITLDSGPDSQPLAGYSAMPYLMATLLGLFPVTLLYGTALQAVIIACYVGLEIWQGSFYTSGSLNTLWILCMICGIVLWIQSGQLLMLLKLYRESSCDPLTGLINRRVLLKILQAEMEKYQQRGEPFSLMMLDLDRFKRINDNYGHITGDEVLKVTARILEQQLRSSDIVARYGGEEFMAVLPGTGAESAFAVAERIRHAIESAEVYSSAKELLPLSTSIGVIEYSGNETIEQAINRADELLYIAKEQGRNRVVFCPESAPAA